MVVFSKETCRQYLFMWMEAEKAVSTGQQYQIENRMLRRADLKEIAERIDFWAEKLAEAEAAENRPGRNRIYRAVPRDL